MDFNRPPEEEARLKALRRERFSNAEGEQRYRRLVEERAQRRQQLIAQGMVSQQGALTEARKIVGTCTLMCPVFEREERELKNNVAPQEVIPGTQRADPARAVKTFHRSAAGNEEPLPEDLRTPGTLLKTMDYLVNAVIAQDQTLQSCHGFVRDRTRSIRQDFTIQNIRDHTTVAACERIARFHIVSLHILCGNKDFAEQQDMEQLRNTLKTLIELYDDHRKAGSRCPNEAEFYAYYIVSHLRDPDAKRVAERLPKHVFMAPVVQQALKLHMLSDSGPAGSGARDPGNRYAAQSLATQFFRAVSSPATPLLLACLAEYRFPTIRQAALWAMYHAFPYQEGKEYPVEDFAQMLAFDSLDEVREFCQLFGVSVNERGVKLGERVAGRLAIRMPEQQPRRMGPNLRAVGSKFLMTPMQAINYGLDARLLSTASPRFVGSSSSARPRPQIDMPAPKPAPMADETPRQVKTIGLGNFAAAPAIQHLGSASAFANGHGGVFSSASGTRSDGLSDIQGKRRDSASDIAMEPAVQRKPLPFTSPFTSATGTVGGSSPFGQSSEKPPMVNPVAQASAAPEPTRPPTLEVSATARPLPTEVPPAAAVAPQPAGAENPPPQPPAPQPEPPTVVWNRPRQRINWTSLTNDLYYNLLESLTLEVAGPLASQAKRHAKVADELADDIAHSIVDYTSAFMAYEEACRCLLFAQAESFRRKALLRWAFSQWSMETAVRQQDQALQQRYMDDLDELIDCEYTYQPTARSNNTEDIFGTPSSRRAAITNNQAAEGGPEYVAPAGFWDSLHLGAECFHTIRRALVRLGNPPLQAAVGVAGTQEASVLSSWIWWQLDPKSCELDPGCRTATYTSDLQALAFKEHAMEYPGDAVPAAQIILLSSEPVSAAEVRSSSLGSSSRAAAMAARIEHALDQARARGTGSSTGTLPLLFVCWCDDSKTGKAVRRLVDRTIGAQGAPGFVTATTLALVVTTAKQQFGAGLEWMCKHILRAKRSTLARVSKAYALVVGTLLQLLQRMSSCVSGLVGHEPVDSETRHAVFNAAVDIANAFVDLINEHILRDPGHTRAGRYPHVPADEEVGRGYFHGILVTDPIAASLIADILASEPSGPSCQPSLGSCLRALEFTVKHRLDALQQSVPSDTYANKHDVSAATRSAAQLSEQHIYQAARSCQRAVPSTAAYVTPKSKRSRSLALGPSPPPLDFGSPVSTPGAAMSICSTSTLSTTKRRRPASVQNLSRLQSAMARASKHLND
ncbi:actin cytoskeleton and mitosis protein [Coemansia sp. RSA 552]|nr:actin cytoskeleton and mitosis protein [Coemansia sp. RSA 552]